MFPWTDLQADCPSEEFTTTYRSDFRPMNERQPWPRIRPGVRPAPGFTSSCQAKCEDGPVVFQHFYKTTSSSCSLDEGSQHPSGSHSPTSLPTFSSAPASSEAAVDSTLRETSGQEAGVPKETRLFAAGNIVMEQLEPKDGFQYQEGVILLSQDGYTFSCDDVLRNLGEEAGPQFLPSQTVVSGRIIGPGVFNFLLLEIENWQNHLQGLSPVRTVRPSEGTPGCPETQDVPPPSSQISQSQVCGHRPTRTRPGRELTEYQDRFGAQWFQPQNQTCSPSHVNLYPSV